MAVDGHCVIELRLLDAASTERISGHDIKVAAESLITDCVGNYGVGGSSTKLGEYQSYPGCNIDM